MLRRTRKDADVGCDNGGEVRIHINATLRTSEPEKSTRADATSQHIHAWSASVTAKKNENKSCHGSDHVIGISCFSDVAEDCRSV